MTPSKNWTMAAAAAALSTMGAFSHSPYYAQAFVFCSNRSPLKMQEKKLRPITRSINSIPFYRRNICAESLKLSPVIMDENTELSDSFYIPPGSNVVARGTTVSFTSNELGRFGLMAIKLLEEDCLGESSTTLDGLNSKVHHNIKTDSRSSLTASGVFTNDKIRKNSTQGDDFTGKTVMFPDGRSGVIVAQRPPLVFAFCDFNHWNAAVDRDIAVLNTRKSIPVGDHLVGSIIDCHGRPLAILGDGSVMDLPANNNVDRFSERDLFAPIPQVKDIALINTPFLTGTAMIDALVPIGKGQNMLVVGQEGLGQKELIVSTIQTQVNEARRNITHGVVCVYAVMAKNKTERANIVRSLKQAGILNHMVLVVMRDDKQDGHGHTCVDKEAVMSAEAITVAATACSIGEAFALSKGWDSSVFIGSVDHHKRFWDWTTRVLVKVYGVDAVVKADLEGGASSEMRAFYSGLIQRAARFNKEKGSGSMTMLLNVHMPSKNEDVDEHSIVYSPDDFSASTEKVKERISILMQKNIPLTARNLQRIQIPLPFSSDTERNRRLALQHIDDLMSMSDGQLWLDEKLYEKGQRPALDPQRSITRVGVGADTDSRADAPALRGLNGGLRFEFAQALCLDGVEPSDRVAKQLLKRDAYLLAMHQSCGETRSLSENCVALLAASLGSFHKVISEGGTAGTKEGHTAVQRILEHVKLAAPGPMKSIDDTYDMSPSIRSELIRIIEGIIV